MVHTSQRVFRSNLAWGALGALLATLGVATADAKDLRLGPASPPGNVTKAYGIFADDVEKSGFKTKTFGLELFNMRQSPVGLRDGGLDVALVITTMFASEFSETNLASDLSMLASLEPDVKNFGALVGGALTEYVVLDCPECVTQFKKQNQ